MHHANQRHNEEDKQAWETLLPVTSVFNRKGSEEVPMVKGKGVWGIISLFDATSVKS